MRNLVCYPQRIGHRVAIKLDLWVRALVEAATGRLLRRRLPCSVARLHLTLLLQVYIFGGGSVCSVDVSIFADMMFT